MRFGCSDTFSVDDTLVTPSKFSGRFVFVRDSANFPASVSVHFSVRKLWEKRSVSRQKMGVGGVMPSVSCAA